MIKLGLLKQGVFFFFCAMHIYLQGFQISSIRKFKIMIAAMKNLQKIANKNSKTKLLH